MATDQRNLLAYLGTDADFRSWGSGLSDQLNDVGLTKTSDTGQVNWVTVARPAAGSYGGYEIWRFNDTEQATLPIFFKLEYGTASAAQDRPGLRWTFGTSSDGAGTIGGQLASALVSKPSASKASTNTLPSYVSYSSGRLHVCTNLDQSSDTFRSLILVERPRDGAGTVSTKGYWVYVNSGAGTNTPQTIPATGTVPSAGGYPPFPPGSGVQSSSGTDVALWPASIVTGGYSYQSFALAYVTADIGELVSVSASYLGAAHTFMPLGDGGGPVDSASAGSLAMLWE